MHILNLFSGRLSIKGYWLNFLLIIVIFAPFVYFFPTVAKDNLLIRFLLGVTILTWLISIFIRRAHDLNKSGIILLLLFVPLVDLFLILYLGFWVGVNAKNNYGKPLSIEQELFPLIVV